jgi:uncharacterized delta-60 repeat protein
MLKIINKWWIFSLIVLLLHLSPPNFLFAQPGSIDKTFGYDGVNIFPIGSGIARILSIAVQADAKIVAAGFFDNGQNLDFSLARLDTNGLLDESFGTNGIVTTDFNQCDNSIRSVVIQNDGKIVVSGYSIQDTLSSFVIARYHKEGTLDATFGNNGVTFTSFGVHSYGFSSAIQDDGDIVVVGAARSLNGIGSNGSSFALARYKPDGSLDTTFGDNGKVLTTIGDIADIAKSVVIQKDGKIVVAGSSTYLEGLDTGPNLALVRYTKCGIIDTTFGIAGSVVTSVNIFSSASDVLLDNDKIIVSGSTYDGIMDKFLLIKYNEDGGRDSTFGTNGMVIMAIGPYDSKATSIVLQSDHKIVEVGYSFDGLKDVFALIRLDQNGAIDSLFGNDGVVLTDINYGDSYLNAAAVQKDEKIVVGGSSQSSVSEVHFAIARYLTNSALGILDRNFANLSLSIYHDPVKDKAVLIYRLHTVTRVSIDLFDIYGNKMLTFLTDQARSPGIHNETLMFPPWISSGMYLILVSTSNTQKTIKVLMED